MRGECCRIVAVVVGELQVLVKVPKERCGRNAVGQAAKGIGVGPELGRRWSRWSGTPFRGMVVL